MAFTPDRPLLNPHFEGYQLSFAQSPALAHVPLEHPPSQVRAGARPLAFQEVASRVRHNHLAVGDATDSAVYVAADRSVVLIRTDDADESGVAVRAVAQLPPPAAPAADAEYPAAAHVAGDVWLVSDGHGAALLLRMPRAPGPAQRLAAWELRAGGDGAAPTPFRLHSAAPAGPGAALAVLSSLAPPAPGARAAFDVWAVHVPLSDAPAPGDAPPPAFAVAWRRRGAHVPLFARHLPAHGAVLLLGGAAYRDASAPPPAPPPPPPPAPGERAPVPRAGEALDDDAAPPPPYAWTQTADSVTVAFALPGGTPAASIAADFAPRALSLRAGALPQPRLAAAPLWDAIRPAESLWTWERGARGAAGLLTLHLDKAHPGTRWGAVFAEGAGAPPDVPETLDPSELAAIRESLDKFTAAALDGGGGGGGGVPSLAAGERDTEVDADVGRPAVLTWVDLDGTSAAPADGAPAVVLSLPLPGTPGAPSLVLKHDLDGPLFALAPPPARAWAHAATFPALAFVLASKRDTRFAFHAGAAAALAFDGGARGAANVYVYRGSARGDRHAPQGVFQLPAGAGALLGVGAVGAPAAATLLCLSERALTVCRGLL